MKRNPLDQMRSVLVLAIFVFIFFIFTGMAYTSLISQVGWDKLSPGEQFTRQQFLWFSSYLLLAWSLWLATKQYRNELFEIIFYVPNGAECKSYLWLSVGMVISAIGFVYLLFYPLSLIQPEFVQSWLLDAPYILYWDANGIYLLGNLLTILTATVLAPIIEEYLFRGYLLNRWTYKIGVWPATFISAALFAVLHTDVLGAFIFAVFMSWLYFKTRSLLAPIIVHMGNNIIAVALEWVDRAYLSGFEPATMQDFHSYLNLGIVCLFVGCFWLWRYAQREFQPIQELARLHEAGKGIREGV